jgi:hypothetical protein
MKVIIVFIILFSISPVHAKMYKCIVEGQVSYQDTECQQGGGEFKKKKDISGEQQQAAAARLNTDLATSAENRRLAKEYADKERLIQAEEDNAYANYQTARQTERQADALEERNYIEQDRFDNRNRVYINPYYNRYSIPRRRPHHRPRPIPTPYPSKLKGKVKSFDRNVSIQGIH